MHKLLSSFLVLSMLCHSVFAATGQVDDRVYVNWSDPEYHKVVVFIQPNGYCTGQYVAPNIILTARHCITPDNIDSYGIELYDGRATLVSLLSYGSGQMFRSDGDWALLLVSDPKFYSDTYFNVARKATPKMTINNTGFGALRILSNAELAQLRQIFSSQRNKMAAESNTNADMIQFSQIFKLVEDDIANLGIPSIMETGNVLKTHFNCEFIGLSQGNMWSTCDIYSGNSGGPYYMGNTLYGTCSGAVHRFDGKDKSAAIPSQSFYEKLQRIISENPPATGTKPKPTHTPESLLKDAEEYSMQVLDEDLERIDQETEAELQKMLDKDSFIQLEKDYSDIKPLPKPTTPVPSPEALLKDAEEFSMQVLDEDLERIDRETEAELQKMLDKDSFIQLEKDYSDIKPLPKPTTPVPSPEALLKDAEEFSMQVLDEDLERIDRETEAELQKMLDKDSFVKLENDGLNIGKLSIPLTPNELLSQKQKLAETDQELLNELDNIDSMSDQEFLYFLDRAAEYEKLREGYEQALARERSLPNRMLGALGIGAGGIGGMMIASGIAEQRADQNAEIDMRAYLATFRCDAGTGKQWKGGETNIELPAGNLTALKTEYVTLAGNLKSRKEQLGLKPGIESETIADSASTGLYDNVASSPIDGVYTSIANAILDENSSDATEWAEQQEKTTTKIQTGTKIGVAGVGGAMIGNMTVNRDMYFNTDQDTDTESEEETESTRNVSKRTTKRNNT